MDSNQPHARRRPDQAPTTPEARELHSAAWFGGSLEAWDNTEQLFQLFWGGVLNLCGRPGARPNVAS